MVYVCVCLSRSFVSDSYPQNIEWEKDQETSELGREFYIMEVKWS